jgi:hypothetical protein
MLTPAILLQLSGPLPQPRNLLFRYVTNRPGTGESSFSRVPYGGKQAQTTCGRYCANLVGVNRGPPEISADESNAGAAFYRQKPSGMGLSSFPFESLCCGKLAIMVGFGAGCAGV